VPPQRAARQPARGTRPRAEGRAAASALLPGQRRGPQGPRATRRTTAQPPARPPRPARTAARTARAVPPRRPRARKRLPLGAPTRRLRWALALVTVLLAALGGRLMQLQAFDSRAYAVQAEQQRLRTVTLSAQRGDIVDRNGAVLATSLDARAVYVDPTEVVDQASTAARLSALLHVPVGDLLDRLSKRNHFQYLAHDVTPAMARRVLELGLPGIGALPERQRVYPGGTLAANLVGAVGDDGKGLGGFEYALDRTLAGVDGEQTMQVGATGTAIPAAVDALHDPVAGSSVQLTIDRDIQYVAQLAIAKQVRRTGAQSGSVIVTDPRTGEVLAMATAPTFDPNRLASADPRTLGNAAVSDVYEPGSVNKVITFSGALQDGVVRPGTPITVPPTYRVAGHTFHDAETHGTLHLTATGVLAKSSNIGTIEVAQRLGADRLYHYLRAFGFGQLTGVRFPGESKGVLPPTERWSGTTLPTVAFGQGISVTALQVATVYGTIANGGVRVTPSLVKGFVDPQGHLRAAAAPAAHRVISARTARQVSDMLEAVTTDEGTAPAARIAGYRVAGKTGTAQRPDGRGGYHGYTSTFVGYAPADAPQLLVEVVLQRPVHGHFGGEVAAPVFHDVMAYALAERHVAPTMTRPPVARLTTR
ncbi:MAG: peptidoglycan D,D-transpeptidase FtsI family protein, partial [Frankiaceae bacterium]